jgi:hypothetical protein
MVTESLNLLINLTYQSESAAMYVQPCEYGTHSTTYLSQA